MKMVSTLAVAAALTLGVATPAAAQRQRAADPAAAPVLRVSDAFRRLAGTAERLLAANDWAGGEEALTQAEAIANNDDERYYAAFMRLKIEVHKQSFEGIIRAADALIASPKTPPAHLGEYYYYRGRSTFLSGKRFDALPFLLKARELGRNETDLPLMLAQIYGDSNRNPEAIAEMSNAIEAIRAAGGRIEESWYNWAFRRIYASGDRSAAIAWSLRWVKDFPTIENWRRIVVLYREMVDGNGTTLDKFQRLDLFRVMRATGALADQADYFDYGKAAVESGLPWEALTVIAEGRAANKIPAGHPDFARLETTAKSAVANESSLDSLAAAAKTGKETASVADAFLASGNYARALELYDKALTLGGADINANAINLHRGVALIGLNRKDEARTAFGLVQGAPLSDIAKIWLTWLDLPALRPA